MINVHSYESMGTFDGPGLRLVVFLQGCPFRCLYCANPDTIDVKGGTPTPAGEILQMAVSQKAFFGKKGGITFSGGEPTLQAEALIPLFKDLKANGIHICLDTNGGIWNDKVEELLSLTDLVLLDIKEFNPERHCTLPDAATNKPCAPLPGWNNRDIRFGCAMSWYRDIVILKKTYATWANSSANTKAYNGWKYFPTTA